MEFSLFSKVDLIIADSDLQCHSRHNRAKYIITMKLMIHQVSERACGSERVLSSFHTLSHLLSP